MLEEFIAEALNRAGHQWKTDQGYIQPTADDVRKVLDNAVPHLYDEDKFTRLETGGLIIEKNELGSFDVYVHVGNYI